MDFFEAFIPHSAICDTVKKITGRGYALGEAVILVSTVLGDDGEEVAVVLVDRELMIACHHVQGGKDIQVSHHLLGILGGPDWNLTS